MANGDLERRDLQQRVDAGYLTQDQMNQQLGGGPPPPPPEAAAPGAPAAPAGGVSPKYIAALKLEAAGQLAPDSPEAKSLDTLRRARQIPTLPTFSTDDPVWDATIKKYNLPRDIFMGLADHESGGFNPQAVSPTGVTGLLQVTKATGADYGLTAYNRTNPWLSVEIGGHHLRTLLDQTNGDVNRALRLWNVDDPNFITSVRAKAAKYTGQPGQPPAPTPPAPGAPPGEPPPPPGAVTTDESGRPVYERPPEAAAQTTTPTTETLEQQYARRVGPLSKDPGIPEIAGKVLLGTQELFGTPVARTWTKLGLPGGYEGGETAGNVADWIPPTAIASLAVRGLTRAGARITPEIATRVLQHTEERIAEHAATQDLARLTTGGQLNRLTVTAADAARQAIESARTRASLGGAAISDTTNQLLDHALQTASTAANRAERVQALQVIEQTLGTPIREVRRLTTETARAGANAAAADETTAALARQHGQATRTLESLQRPTPPSIPRRILREGLRAGLTGLGLGTAYRIFGP